MFGDARQPVFDRQCVEVMRVAFAQPLAHLFMIGVFWIVAGFKQIIKARHAAAVFRRRGALAAEIARIMRIRIALPNIRDDDSHAPVVTEIINVA